MAEYWQRGESIDYMNTGDTPIEQGTVMPLGTRIGITGGEILPGQLGSLHVTGVFIMPKAAGVTFDIGAEAYYSTADNSITDADTDVPAGWVVKAAAADDAVAYIKIGG